MVTNAGGLNPRACADACVEVLRESGCNGMTVGLVTGDDVLPLIQAAPGSDSFNHLESGAPIAEVFDSLVTANAYTGARGGAEALAQGADIVITGRIADPSMAVIPAVHHFGWAWDDYTCIAGATVAGHVIECGSQACGGISTEWLDLPNLAELAFPVVELEEDGSFTVTIPENAGGAVNERIVKEQLLYEIGDLAHYLSPDVALSFLTLEVEEVGANRVRVSGASGFAPPETLKVSATYRDGFSATGQLTIYGHDAAAKAEMSGALILGRLKNAGYEYARSNVECVGAGACVPGVFEAPDLRETVLRVSVADPRREAVERFTKEISPLTCGGAQGTRDYAGRLACVHRVYGFWPCLIAANRVDLSVQLVEV